MSNPHTIAPGALRDVPVEALAQFLRPYNVVLVANTKGGVTATHINDLRGKTDEH